MTKQQTVVGATFWQHVSADPFAEGNWATFTDKLLGLEVCTNGPGKESTCVPIPVDDVPSLLRSMMRWIAEGNMAIARDADSVESA